MLTRSRENLWIPVLLWCLAAFGHPVSAAAQQQAASFPVFTEGERLTWRLLWPSGISLGEAVFQATPSGEQLHFQLTVDASLPHYTISDFFSSDATREGLCSIQFQKTTREGARTLEESIAFDQEAHQARKTLGNQTSTVSIPECARDPLTFLYYFRSRLAAGKTLDSGEFLFGENYKLRIEAAGPETVAAGGRQWDSEKYVLTYIGPNSQKTFELWVSTDSHRKPVRARVPLPLAVFSAEME